MSLDTGPDLPPAIPSETRAKGVSPVLIVAMIAFVAGLALMALGMRWWLNERAEPAPVETALTVPTEQPSPNDPVALQARADTLTMRIAELERRLDDVDTGSRTASGFASRAEGLMVAFAARRALDRGTPLGYIEGLLRERFGGGQPQAVAIILSAARQPVTLEELQTGLDTVAPQLTARAPDESWWDGIRQELSGLVVVRRASTPSIAPVDRLTRARRQLEMGHVDLALAEVARLPGRAAAADWIVKARRYASARSALDIIETAALLAPHVAPAVAPPVVPAPTPAAVTPPAVTPTP